LNCVLANPVKYSWVPSTFSGQGAACLFDANLNRKPAYYGVVSALSGAQQPSSNASAHAVTSPSGMNTSFISLSSQTATSASVTNRKFDWIISVMSGAVVLLCFY